MRKGEGSNLQSLILLYTIIQRKAYNRKGAKDFRAKDFPEIHQNLHYDENPELLNKRRQLELFGPRGQRMVGSVKVGNPRYDSKSNQVTIPH
jgi:hypothetical protein